MKAVNLPREVAIEGLGVGKWLWQCTGSLAPAGIIVYHDDHMMVVPWADSPLAEGGFTVDSLLPLTVVEDIVCSCGQRGRIDNGAWSQVTEGVGA